MRINAHGGMHHGVIAADNSTDFSSCVIGIARNVMDLMGSNFMTQGSLFRETYPDLTIYDHDQGAVHDLAFTLPGKLEETKLLSCAVPSDKGYVPRVASILPHL